jgi:hypothetical protein
LRGFGASIGIDRIDGRTVEACDVDAKNEPGVAMVIMAVALAVGSGANARDASAADNSLFRAFSNPGNNGVHGLNEQVRISDLFASREFPCRLVKALAGAKPAD